MQNPIGNVQTRAILLTSHQGASRANYRTLRDCNIATSTPGT
jgi:hypothetical protein